MICQIKIGSIKILQKYLQKIPGTEIPGLYQTNKINRKFSLLCASPKRLFPLFSGGFINSHIIDFESMRKQGIIDSFFST